MLGVPGVLAVLVGGCDAEARAERYVPVAAVPGGNPERGVELVGEYGCNTCHTIPGVRNARGRVGPPLEGIANRVYLAGTLFNTPENMMRWIRDPQEVQPGNAMPDLGLSSAEAWDITAFLYTLSAKERFF